jgi:hypothetical protein
VFDIGKAGGGIAADIDNIADNPAAIQLNTRLINSRFLE